MILASKIAKKANQICQSEKNQKGFKTGSNLRRSVIALFSDLYNLQVPYKYLIKIEQMMRLFIPLLLVAIPSFSMHIPSCWSKTLHGRLDYNVYFLKASDFDEFADAVAKNTTLVSLTVMNYASESESESGDFVPKLLQSLLSNQTLQTLAIVVDHKHADVDRQERIGDILFDLIDHNRTLVSLNIDYVNYQFHDLLVRNNGLIKNTAFPTMAYHRTAIAMGVQFLHLLNQFAEDVEVAIIDVPDEKSNARDAPSDHALNMNKIISTSFESNYSVAPKADVKLYSTAHWHGFEKTHARCPPTPHYFFSGREENGTIISCTEKTPTFSGGNYIHPPVTRKGFLKLVDVTISDDLEDDEFAELFETCIKSKILIVNMSRDFLFGAKTEIALQNFIDAGGIVVKAAGNGAFNWYDDGIYPKNTNLGRQLHISVLDIHLFQLLKQKPELAKGFLVVQSLENYSASSLTNQNNGRGDLVPDRFIAAWGAMVDNTFSSGTSAATASVTGIVALLRGAFPAVSLQTIAQTLLDTATDYESHRSIDAKAAYLRLKEASVTTASLSP